MTKKIKKYTYHYINEIYTSKLHFKIMIQKFIRIIYFFQCLASLVLIHAKHKSKLISYIMNEKCKVEFIVFKYDLIVDYVSRLSGYPRQILIFFKIILLLLKK